MPSKSKSFGKKTSSKQTSNPFQQKWAKSNQTLLRKRSQSTALAKHPRHNVFRDRRIGENDPTLDDENRYLYRLQRERTKRVRKRARFSLADDEGHESGAAGLPEFRSPPQEDGGLLSEGDEEDSVEELDDGDELIKLKSPNEGTDEDRGERTRQEIMDEVVQKSKMYKAQRQHEKFVTDEQTAKLDEDLPQLMQMLAKSGAEYEQIKPKLSLSLKNKPQSKAIFDAAGAASTPAASKQAFHYDDVYRQLANEKRARPSERLLTEEEKAERERDRLMELEKQRKSRMESMGDTDEESEEESTEKRGKKRRREKGGDDLDDDFGVPELGEASEPEEEENSSESEDDNLVLDENDKEQQNEEHKEISESFWEAVDRQSLPAVETSGDEDIPFVFKKCPVTSVELQHLMTGKTIEQRSVVLDRIRKCFAESLNPARNRPKLERLLACILFRIERLAELEADHVGSGITEINMLLNHVYKMGQKFEPTISAWSRRQLFDMHKKLGSPDTCLSVAWAASDVVVARAIGRLYPSSDIRHPVSTPLALLLSESISMSRITSVADVALGIFVASVLLEVVVGREGYSGEVGKFVYETVLAMCPESEVMKPGKLRGMFKELEVSSEETKSRLSMKDVLKLLETPELGRKIDFQRKVAYAMVSVVEGMNFSGQHRNWDIMLSGLPIEKLANANTRDRLLNVVSKSQATRVPLSLYTSSRKPIVKALNPKYTAESGVYRKRPKTSFQARVQGDMSASAKRVERALRKEERGLTRDVRREAQVMAAIRAREEQVKDEDRDHRHRQVMSFFEHQQATWKAAEKRQKKLSGRKW